MGSSRSVLRVPSEPPLENETADTERKAGGYAPLRREGLLKVSTFLGCGSVHISFCGAAEAVLLFSADYFHSATSIALGFGYV